jgi:hypothetical protein
LFDFINLLCYIKSSLLSGILQIFPEADRISADPAPGSEENLAAIGHVLKDKESGVFLPFGEEGYFFTGRLNKEIFYDR